MYAITEKWALLLLRLLNTYRWLFCQILHVFHHCTPPIITLGLRHWNIPQCMYSHVFQKCGCLLSSPFPCASQESADISISLPKNAAEISQWEKGCTYQQGKLHLKVISVSNISWYWSMITPLIWSSLSTFFSFFIHLLRMRLDYIYQKILGDAKSSCYFKYVTLKL